MINRFIMAKSTILLALFMPALAQSLMVTVDNSWGGIFAGDIVPFAITVTREPNSAVFVSWKLVSKGRTLSRGEQVVNLRHSGTVMANLPLQTPPLKPGVNIAAKLIVDATVDSRSEAAEHYEFQLDLYGPDIFLVDQHLYQKLNIHLFDPIGKTAEVFEALKIPYSALSRPQLLNHSSTGLLIIGAGVALDDYRNLSAVLVDMARDGRNILVLQPNSGEIPLSEMLAGNNIEPPVMSFSDESIVQLFMENYRWKVADPMNSQSIILSSDRRIVLVQIKESGIGGWDWFHLNFKQTGGQLIVCMLPFVDQLGSEPIKQKIFGHLLGYAGGQASVSKVLLQRNDPK